MSERGIAQRPSLNGLAAETAERVLLGGDLSKLSPGERLAYYARVCESLGLNPLTRPFEYLHLNGRLVLYATRTCTDQLAAQRQLSLSVVHTERLEDVYLVTARASGPDGRSVENVGAVSIANLRGDALANALMKAQTKAYRRATLSFCGLGWLDETEIETVPAAATAVVDHATGELGERAETPAESLERLWQRWHDLSAAATALGVAHKQPPRTLAPEKLLAWCARLQELVDQAERERDPEAF